MTLPNNKVYATHAAAVASSTFASDKTPYTPIEFKDRVVGAGSDTASFTVPASSPYTWRVPVPISKSGVTVTVGGNSRTLVETAPSSGQVQLDRLTGVLTFHSTDAAGAAIYTATPYATAISNNELAMIQSQIVAAQTLAATSVIGPGSATDNAVVRFDGTTGKLVQNTSQVTITDAGVITSTVSTGTAPLVVASTTAVANLNASLLLGSTWASPAAIGTGTPAAGTFTALSATSAGITGATTVTLTTAVDAAAAAFFSTLTKSAANTDTGQSDFAGRFVATDSGTFGVASDTDILYGISGVATHSGATSGSNANKTVYGVYGTSSVSGAVSSGSSTRIAYGGYFSATASADGTSTAYGIYATTAGSPDTAWAGYFSGNVNVTGSTTTAGLTSTGTVDLTGAVISGASPLVFEGATANDFETTFAITDPTADRTITFPDASGTVAVSASGTLSLSAAGALTWSGASPGAIGGTTPAAITGTTITGTSVVNSTTRWTDWAALGVFVNGLDDPTGPTGWYNNGDLTGTFIQCGANTRTTIMSIPYGAGTTLKRLRIKWQGGTGTDGIKFTLVKRDDSSTATSFTTIGAQQSPATSASVTVTTYDFADEVMAEGYSYSIILEAVVAGTLVKVFSVGIETSNRTL